MRTFTRFTAVALSAVLAAHFAAAEPPPELATIPPDAIAFSHVRAADLWMSDALADYRKALWAAGPDVLGRLDDQFAPPLSTVDRLTYVALPPKRTAPVEIVIARFTKPFDHARVVAGLVPGDNQAFAGDRRYHEDDYEGLALTFPDDRTILASRPREMQYVLTRQPGPASRILEVLNAGVDRNYVTAAADFQQYFQKHPYKSMIEKEVPPEYRPLLKTGLVTLTVSEAGRFNLRADYPTADDATTAEKSFRALAGLARQEVAQARPQFEQQLTRRRADGPPRSLGHLPDAVAATVALGLLTTADEFLANPPLIRDGAKLTMAVDPPAVARGAATAPVLIALLGPAVGRYMADSERRVVRNNLKSIGLAVQNYHDTYSRFPTSAITHKKTGEPLLSWRVEMLPYLGQEALYKQFRLDQPWDSDHNRKLIDKMPRVYADPRVAAGPGLTCYKTFVGPGTPIQPRADKCLNLGAMPDGSSNTLLVVACGDTVVWTKPEDIDFDPNKPLPDLTRPITTSDALFYDGSVRTLKGLTEKQLRGAVTADGDEVIIFP